MDNKKIPSILYKYYEPGKNWNYFCGGSIRFTPISEFNDPFEGKKIIKEEFGWNWFKLMMDYKKQNLSSYNITDSKNYRRNLFVLFNLWGALCLTPDCKNILMWSHYARRHTGFVVGFDMHSDFFKNLYNTTSWQVRPVEYVPFPPTVSGIKGLVGDKLLDTLFKKSKIWDYEEEYRIVAPIDSEQYQFKTVEGKKGIHELPKGVVREIVFGAMMNDKTVQIYCRSIRNREDCQHIKLKRAALHETKYELKIVDIPEKFYEKSK